MPGELHCNQRVPGASPGRAGDPRGSSSTRASVGFPEFLSSLANQYSARMRLELHALGARGSGFESRRLQNFCGVVAQR